MSGQFNLFSHYCHGTSYKNPLSSEGKRLVIRKNCSENNTASMRRVVKRLKDENFSENPFQSLSIVFFPANTTCIGSGLMAENVS
jgi:hypothetical protein